VLLPLTAFEGAWKHEGHIAMSRKPDPIVASIIGIDTGKNTLHLVDLDNRGTIVLREKLGRALDKLNDGIRNAGYLFL
jgi:hypothetical protein